MSSGKFETVKRVTREGSGRFVQGIGVLLGALTAITGAISFASIIGMGVNFWELHYPTLDGGKLLILDYFMTAHRENAVASALVALVFGFGTKGVWRAGKSIRGK